MTLPLQDHAWRPLDDRDKGQVEADVMPEVDSGLVAGFEMKAAASVNASDFADLRKLTQTAGDDFIGSVLLYDDPHVVSFSGNLRAAPFFTLWTA